MIKHGNPPYLECSSKGDKRFSAFYAEGVISGRIRPEQLISLYDSRRLSYTEEPKHQPVFTIWEVLFFIWLIISLVAGLYLYK